MSTEFDSKTFFDKLVSHQLIHPSGIRGVFGRGRVFEDVVERFNALVSRIAAADGAEPRTFPPVIERSIIERVHYMDSFPHLCGAVYSFSGTERQARELAADANDGKPWGQHLSMTDLVLTPAACYPVYPTLSGTLEPGGRLITTMNWVFRREPSLEPTRLQSFRMREYIRVGSAEEVMVWRDMWLQRGMSLLRGLGLDAASDVASDPFFGRGGKVLAGNQREQKLKFEILVPVISDIQPTAVCSFNFHQEHFGSTFDIRQADGSTANTACIGFGLERVAMALFKSHGFVPSQWPAAVREQLWP